MTINSNLSSLNIRIVCADDTVKHKPNPEPLYKYMDLMKCALSANVDFGLAKWGAKGMLEASYIFSEPKSLMDLIL